MTVVRVVAAVWIRDGRVLAGQRPAHKKQGGHWELPGGKVEPGESDADAIVRELEEELGATVRPIGALATATHPFESTLIEVVAWHVEGEAEPHPHEHDAIRWVGADDLDALDWAPADRELLTAVRARLGGGGE